MSWYKKSLGFQRWMLLCNLTNYHELHGIELSGSWFSRAILELQNLVGTVRLDIYFLMETKLPKNCMLLYKYKLGFSCGMAVGRHGLAMVLPYFSMIIWIFFAANFSHGHIHFMVRNWHLGELGWFTSFYGHSEGHMR